MQFLGLTKRMTEKENWSLIGLKSYKSCALVPEVTVRCWVSGRIIISSVVAIASFATSDKYL